MKNKPIKLLIWGGGTDFRNALSGLHAREENGEIRIVGVVDRNHPESGKICGYPHFFPTDIPRNEYDYLRILSTKYRREIRNEYLKIPGIDPRKLITHVFPELREAQFVRLADDRPTIFSQSC